MYTSSNLGLRRLIEYNKRNSPLPSLSNVPTVSDIASEAQANFLNNDDDNNYAGLDFKRVSCLERRQVERSVRGGPKSWIYRYGWAV